MPKIDYRRQPRILRDFAMAGVTKAPPAHDVAEIDGDMTINDITKALRMLRFGNGAARRTVTLDAAVRDYLVEALQRK